MSETILTQEELKKLNQDTRDSIRGKNNYSPFKVFERRYPQPVHNDLSAERDHNDEADHYE